VLGATHRAALGRIAPGTTADQILHAAPCAVAVAPAGYAERAEDGAFGVIGAAIDDGDDGLRVARLAAGIARTAGATLRLITVADSHPTAGPYLAGGPGYAALTDAVRERTTAALERATAAAGPGLRIERRAGEGSAADGLIAESGALDLLVAGSRGYGPVRRVLPGTVGAKVLRGAACPVLVLPRGVPEELMPSVVGIAGAASVPAS
jgi:nucleotide-binding universal stress UspA family protein